MILLSNSLFKTPSFLCSSLKQIRLVTGNWSFFFEEAHKELLYPFTDRAELTDHFLEDTLFIAGALCLFAALWLITIFVAHCCRREGRTDSRLAYGSAPSRAELAVKLIYMLLFFPGVAGFFCIIAISAYVNNLRLANSQEAAFPNFINSAALLTSWLIAACVFAFECLDLKWTKAVRGFRGLKSTKNWYIPLFLSRMVVITIFFQAGISCSFDLLIYPIAITMILYLAFIIAFRPYAKAMDWIGAIVCEAISLYSIGLPLAARFVVVGEEIEVFLLFILEGIIIIAAIVALVRTIRVYRGICSKLLFPRKTGKKKEQFPADQSTKQEKLLEELSL